MNENADFERRFVNALAQVPDMPDCFPGIAKKIRKRHMIFRIAFAAAASIVLFAGALTVVEHGRNAQAAQEVTEELQRIHSHINGDDIRQEIVSCSLVDDESY